MSRSFKTLAEVEQILLTGKPRRRFVVPGVLPAGPCFLYGASGSGKTGIAVLTAIAVSAGLTWADRAVQQGSVLYVAGEDYDGVQDVLSRLRSRSGYVQPMFRWP